MPLSVGHFRPLWYRGQRCGLAHGRRPRRQFSSPIVSGPTRSEDVWGRFKWIFVPYSIGANPAMLRFYVQDTSYDYVQQWGSRVRSMLRVPKCVVEVRGLLCQDSSTTYFVLRNTLQCMRPTECLELTHGLMVPTTASDSERQGSDLTIVTGLARRSRKSACNQPLGPYF